MCVCVCSLKVTEQLKTTTKMYICQSWETSDIKCQRARWNTDKFPPFFFFSPFIFKQMLWIFILLYKICRKTKKKKKFNSFFSSNQTKWERTVCKLVVVALKDGSRKYKEPHQGTSEPRDWTPVCSCYLQQQQNEIIIKDRSALPLLFLSVSLRKHPSIKLHTAVWCLFKQLFI